MPIRPELRWFYPIDWKLISRSIRFGRAKARCERCRRPHLTRLVQLADGRWFDEPSGQWRGDDGAEAAWPDMIELMGGSRRRYALGTAHLDHDPQNSRWANLAALCQRCHLAHDRLEHRRRRRLTHLRRRAVGDLFSGTYARW